jgi:PTS system nitrogen regulatory IIA component
LCTFGRVQSTGIWQGSFEVTMGAAGAVGSTMKLTELFPPAAIRVGLDQQTKSAVIEALVQHAVALGRLRCQEERRIVDTILAREDLASTGLGHGLAMPHCQWETLDRFVGVLGLLQRGIPFDSLDGEPVDRVFLALTPPDAPEQSFEVLGRLVALGRNQSLRLLFRDCRTPEQVSAFLNEIDQPVAGHLDDLVRMSLTWTGREQGDPWRDLTYFSLMREDHPDRNRAGGSGPEPRWL